MCSNNGIPFDKNMLDIPINKPAIDSYIENFTSRLGQTKESEIASLLRSLKHIDLTTLCGDDTKCNISRLCYKAHNPIQDNILYDLGFDPKKIHVAAVCVYPSHIKQCTRILDSLGSNVRLAVVGGGFPSGQFKCDTKNFEISNSIQDGAHEIDVVINRELVIRGKWEELYNEVKSMKEACGSFALLKVILAVGELGSFTNIYKASMISMMAGADFIKTSTGKEAVNATLPIGVVMTRAIKDYYDLTHFKVGFKAAGGIRTTKDCLTWQLLIEKELGKEWVNSPNLFRIGASSLLGDIEQYLFYYVYGIYPSINVCAYG